MKKITNLFGLLLLAIVMIKCHEEEITPMSKDDGGQKISDTLSVANGAVQAEDFSFIGEKKEETDSGFKVNGALYLKTDSGDVSVIEEAAFTVTQNAEGNMESMEGTGAAQLPDLGIFKDFNLQEAAEATFIYNTGKFFKDNNEDFAALPLRDTSYYFFFNLLNLASGSKEDMVVKNAKLGITSYFVNIPQQEVIIPTGSFEINLPGESSFSVGEDIAIGISGKKSFHFTPQQFSDTTISDIIDERKPFADMTGFLFLSGEISLGDEIPMKIGGNSVLDGDMDLIFSEGFGSASFSYAANGKLIFGHDLLDLLPVDLEVELTTATYKLEHKAEGAKQNFDLKFAGKFDDNVWMENILDKIAGTNISQYVPFTGNEGSMFASFGNDWEFFVDTYFAINAPHLGKQPTRRGTLHITEEQLKVRGALAIPFVPGELAATGVFGYDGNIHLEAKGDSEIEIEGVKMDSHLDFDIYNDKATLAGNVDVPFGIGNVDVQGEINSDGLSFTGHVGNKRDIDFGNNVIVPLVNFDISVAINKTNPKFGVSGEMYLQQLAYPLVAVSGDIDSRGIALTGDINSQLNINDLNVPMINTSLTAKTWEGVYFNGTTKLPYGIGYFDVNGRITGANGLPEIWLKGTATSNPTMSIDGFSFPTSNLNFIISTFQGVSFDGNIKFPSNLGWADLSGKINGQDITFNGSLGEYVALGGYSLKSDLTIERKANSKYPFVWKGTVYTPAGIDLSVNGHILNDGRVFTFGRLNVDLTVDLPDFPGVPDNAGIDGKVTFEFGGDIWVYADARGCVGDDCVDFDRIFITYNWNAVSDLELCFPLGEIVSVLPDKCVNISDLY